MSSRQPTYRFAPSPNGYLHLGHAYSGLLNDALARAGGGRLLLRIEDIDHGRCRPEFIRALGEDLAWLGLRWQTPVRRQSEHLSQYSQVMTRLRARGLVYACFCSRQDIARAVAGREAAAAGPWPRDPDGVALYPGTCKGLARAAGERIAAGEPHAWRLDSTAALAAVGGSLTYIRFVPSGGEEAVSADPACWGDLVLARKDVTTSYHLAVVVDDALQEVTHVVRGQDLEAATDLHRLLQALLGLPSPRYHHHALLRDELGGKLSKSLRAPAIRDLRLGGITAAHIRHTLGF